ncbi:MAG: ribonuclease P protein component [Pseudomonadales bacterium]|nr:ribonuclease P protein component [Pseudomonadales bacterium]
MLPKSLKLDLRSDKSFFFNCKKKHSRYFSLFYKKNNELGLKIAIIVPKKLVNLATKRNKIKRIFSSSINLILEDKNIKLELFKKSLDLALVVNKGGLEIQKVKLAEIIKGSLIEIEI